MLFGLSGKKDRERGEWVREHGEEIFDRRLGMRAPALGAEELASYARLVRDFDTHPRYEKSEIERKLLILDFLLGKLAEGEVDIPEVLAPGTSIGPYRIIRKIGSGLTASAFLSRNAETGDFHAVKLFDVANVEEKKVGAFVLESLMALEVSNRGNPHLCGANSVLCSARNRRFLLVMPFVPGRRLDEYGRDELPLRVWVWVLHVLSGALDSFGSAGDFLGHPRRHGDLHGGNIIMGGDTAAMPAIVDWGSCSLKLAERKALPCRAPECLDPKTLSATGVDISACPGIFDSPVGPKADVFGLGVTFYKLLRGASPYPVSADGLVVPSAYVAASAAKHAARKAESSGLRALDELLDAMVDPRSSMRPEFSEVAARTRDILGERPTTFAGRLAFRGSYDELAHFRIFARYYPSIRAYLDSKRARPGIAIPDDREVLEEFLSLFHRDFDSRHPTGEVKPEIANLANTLLDGRAHELQYSWVSFLRLKGLARLAPREFGPEGSEIHARWRGELERSFMAIAAKRTSGFAPPLDKAELECVAPYAVASWLEAFVIYTVTMDRKAYEALVGQVVGFFSEYRFAHRAFDVFRNQGQERVDKMYELANARGRSRLSALERAGLVAELRLKLRRDELARLWVEARPDLAGYAAQYFIQSYDLAKVVDFYALECDELPAAPGLAAASLDSALGYLEAPSVREDGEFYHMRRLQVLCLRILGASRQGPYAGLEPDGIDAEIEAAASHFRELGDKLEARTVSNLEAVWAALARLFLGSRGQERGKRKRSLLLFIELFGTSLFFLERLDERTRSLLAAEPYEALFVLVYCYQSLDADSYRTYRKAALAIKEKELQSLAHIVALTRDSLFSPAAGPEEEFRKNVEKCEEITALIARIRDLPTAGRAAAAAAALPWVLNLCQICFSFAVTHRAAQPFLLFLDFLDGVRLSLRETGLDSPDIDGIVRFRNGFNPTAGRCEKNFHVYLALSYFIRKRGSSLEARARRVFRQTAGLFASDAVLEGNAPNYFEAMRLLILERFASGEVEEGHTLIRTLPRPPDSRREYTQAWNEMIEKTAADPRGLVPTFEALVGTEREYRLFGSPSPKVAELQGTAIRAYRAGEREVAGRAIFTALLLDPDNPAVVCTRGNALKKPGAKARLEEALVCYGKALSLTEGRYSESWYNASNSFRDLGDGEREAYCAMRSADCNPEDRDAVNKAAVFRAMYGSSPAPWDYEEAASRYDSLLERL
jgi:serine/threonine protein kinase